MPANKLTCFTLAALLAAVPCTAAEDDGLQALATASCEMPGLAVAPPQPWYSVPIESGDPVVEGCQLIWEEGEQYMGIMRLVSFDLREKGTGGEKWENLVIAFESMVMDSMGFKLGKPIWKRDPVAVAGEGFGNGKAIALEASLEGVAHANEAHFLLFDSASHKYVISLITPTEAASPDIYRANTKAMGQVLQTLQAR